jgi:hypothetical protein
MVGVVLNGGKEMVDKEEEEKKHMLCKLVRRRVLWCRAKGV